MNRTSTAKEALIAEALGDMATLMDRVEAVPPAMNRSHQALAAISERLVQQISTFELRVATLAQKAIEITATHIDRRANAVATKTLHEQTLAMQATARETLNRELYPAVNRVVTQLEYLTRLAQPRHNPWMPWLTHGAAFVTGAALTWLIVVMIWVR